MPCWPASGRNSQRWSSREGEAFRLGGDEFCALIPTAERSVEAISSAAVEALSEHGKGFDISTAYGCIMLPAEAQDQATALQLVDERLYVDKRSRQHSDAPDQLRKVLLAGDGRARARAP